MGVESIVTTSKDIPLTLSEHMAQKMKLEQI